jgi:putative Holliday junction resolvase
VSESGVLATPLSTLRNEGDVLATLAKLVTQMGVEHIVVGVARRAVSAAGEEKFRRFAEELRQRTCKPVELWDESLSTVEAMEQLRSAGRRRRDAERDIDMHAAAVILQSWLDHRAGRTP